MRPLATLTALLASAALLGGCGMMHAAQQSAASSFHTSFRTSFRTGFMKSCTAQPGATEKLCGCVEDALAANNTDDQLMKLSSDSDAADKQITAATAVCKAKK